MDSRQPQRSHQGMMSQAAISRCHFVPSCAALHVPAAAAKSHHGCYRKGTKDDSGSIRFHHMLKENKDKGC